MSLFFTLFYIFIAYLAPSTVFGDLAQYHVEVYAAIIALLASLFVASGSGLFKMSQTYGVLALFVCVTLSLAFNGVVRSVPDQLMIFVTNGIAYFFVLWTCRTRFQIEMLVVTLLLVGLFVVYQGATAVAHEQTASPYVFMMGSEGARFFRVRGLGFINDPNDLCQFLVGLIPCVFILWRRGQFLRNLLVVLLPVSVLLYGMFLTHSRGGMVGLLAALIILGRRRFGILPAVITGGVLFVALSAIGWSGGRDINAESGADRMEAWSTGLTLIRTHPLFGVGYRRFEEYFYITAHNTIVVCAAEIGLVGLFFWMLMVVPTFYELAITARKPAAMPDADPADPLRSPLPQARAGAFKLPASARAPAFQMAFAAPGIETGPVSRAASAPLPALSARKLFASPKTGPDLLAPEEIRRLCGLMIVSLSGYFAAGWFLSRSYTMVLFVNIGMAMAIHRLGVEHGVAPGYLPLKQSAKYAGIATVLIVALVYAMLRITNLLPK